MTLRELPLYCTGRQHPHTHKRGKVDYEGEAILGLGNRVCTTMQLEEFHKIGH